MGKVHQKNGGGPGSKDSQKMQLSQTEDRQIFRLAMGRENAQRKKKGEGKEASRRSGVGLSPNPSNQHKQNRDSNRVELNGVN